MLTGQSFNINRFDFGKLSMDIGKDTIQMDKLTHFILMHWCMRRKLSEHKLSALDLHTAFVCADKGYCLIQHPMIGTISHLQSYPEFLAHSLPPPSPTAKADIRQPLKDEVVMSITSQLINILACLSDLEFSHGNPSAEYMVIDSQLTVKLISTSKSTLVWPTSKGKLRLQTKHDFTPRSRRHIGKMNDFYYIMVGLMCESPFYETMKSKPVWNMMWPNPEEKALIDTRVKEQHIRHDMKYLTSEQISDMLVGLNLQSDIIPILRNWFQMAQV